MDTGQLPFTSKTRPLRPSSPASQPHHIRTDQPIERSHVIIWTFQSLQLDGASWTSKQTIRTSSRMNSKTRWLHFLSLGHAKMAQHTFSLSLLKHPLIHPTPQHDYCRDLTPLNPTVSTWNSFFTHSIIFLGERESERERYEGAGRREQRGEGEPYVSGKRVRGGGEGEELDFMADSGVRGCQRGDVPGGDVLQ